MRPNKKISRWLSSPLWLATLLIVGCGNHEKKAELEAYVKTVKSRAIKEIEPLPEVKPYETYTYRDSAMRSPFVAPKVEPGTRKSSVDNGIRPDVNRRKEPLEAFPIDGLRMMGTVEKEGQKWAIIADPKGTIHRITVGNYLGQSDGKVDAITEEKIAITEIVPDPNGGWRQKKANLMLAVEPNKQKH